MMRFGNGNRFGKDKGSFGKDKRKREKRPKRGAFFIGSSGVISAFAGRGRGAPSCLMENPRLFGRLRNVISVRP